MPVHDQVLRAAQRLCSEAGEWTFSAEQVVRALAHLNENSVRAHVSSRCCVNAPANHPHRWPYFRRIARGRYEILAPYRVQSGRREAPRRPPTRTAGTQAAVAEGAPDYGRPPSLRDTIHAVLHRDGRLYFAECLEVAVVTQGGTLDEVLANLREAVTLHLEGEEPASFGLTRRPRLVVTYEVPMQHAAQA